MRADRLISILLLLQMHTRLTARHLAKRLEVSERTIHRDMEALGAAGVPVVADRGVGGGWSLMEGYRANVSGLTEAEVQALFVTRPSRILADLQLDKASDGALVKLLSVLPAVNRRGAELARQRIHIDVSGWSRSRDPVPHLPTLQQAVWSDRRVRMTYDRGEGCTSERVLDPLGLVAKGAVWYLVARVVVPAGGEKGAEGQMRGDHDVASSRDGAKVADLMNSEGKVASSRAVLPRRGERLSEAKGRTRGVDAPASPGERETVAEMSSDHEVRSSRALLPASGEKVPEGRMRGVAPVENEIRSYRVSRIRDLTILEEPFLRPPDFDLAAFWEKSAETFRERLPRFNVVARVRPDALPLLQLMIRFGGIDAIAGDQVTMHFDSEEVARITLLGFGTAVEILEPASLREGVRAEGWAVGG